MFALKAPSPSGRAVRSRTKTRKKGSKLFRKKGAGRAAFFLVSFAGSFFGWGSSSAPRSSHSFASLYLGRSLIINKRFLFSLATKFFCSRLPRAPPRRFLVCGAYPLRFARVAWQTLRLSPSERPVILPAKSVLQPAPPLFSETIFVPFFARGCGVGRHVQKVRVLSRRTPSLPLIFRSVLVLRFGSAREDTRQDHYRHAYGRIDGPQGDIAFNIRISHG